MNMFSQGRRKLLYGQWGLSKNVGHHGWSTRKNFEKSTG